MTDLIGTEATVWVLDNGNWIPSFTGTVRVAHESSLVLEVTGTTPGAPPKGTLHRAYFQAGQGERLMVGGGA